MMTATARKTSLENKHLRNCDCFVIIPSCSHFTMLTVVSQADYTDHLVFAPGTLGQCKARQLRQRKHGDYVYLLF